MIDGNPLAYLNVWESIFEGDPERAKDYEELSKLVMKYDNEVQLHFGTPDEYRELKNGRLKLQALEQEGVVNWDGYDNAMKQYLEWTE
jgi:hypothetical protein